MAFGDYATLLDNFNRANTGPPPSSDWTTILNGHKIVSNVIVGNNAAASNISAWDTATYGGAVECYVTVPTKMADGTYIEIAARLTTLSAATIDGYLVRCTAVAGAGNDTWRIYRLDNGSYTALGTGSVTGEFTAGDKIGIECNGSTITAYHYTGGAWSSKTSVTDTTYSAAGYVGLTSVNAVATFDDFYAGTITARKAMPIFTKRTRVLIRR